MLYIVVLSLSRSLNICRLPGSVCLKVRGGLVAQRQCCGTEAFRSCTLQAVAGAELCRLELELNFVGCSWSWTLYAVAGAELCMLYIWSWTFVGCSQSWTLLAVAGAELCVLEPELNTAGCSWTLLAWAKAKLCWQESELKFGGSQRMQIRCYLQ